MKRFGIVLAAALIAVLAIGVLGVAAQAQTATPTQNSTLSDYVEQMWDAVASKLGIAREDLDKAVTEAKKEVADKAVEEGAITQEQADRIASGKLGEFGFGRMGRHGGRMMGRGLMGGPGGCVGDQGTLAEQLGMTTDELAAELKAGKTIDEIAEEKGVDLQAARLEAMKKELAQRVADGEITQEQADWMLQGMENGFMGGPGGPKGFFGPMGRMGHHGWGDESVQPKTDATTQDKTDL
jgi:hypothetical protein